MELQTIPALVEQVHSNEAWFVGSEDEYDFGSIEFVGVGAGSFFGKKSLQFVKVSSTVDQKVLSAKLVEKWKLDTRSPNLLLSVLGGCWDFPTTSYVTKVFRKGIVEAAKSGKAWIITDGIHSGVTKYVGKAITNHELATRSTGSIVTIGVATWNTLRKDQRDEMTCALDEKLKYTAKLSTKRSSQKGVFLDQNHTHFILVDDDNTNDVNTEELRRKIEKEMSTEWKVTGHNKDLPQLPIVYIVIEGGLDTIRQAHAAVWNDAPVVVIDNSGRAANIIAKATKCTTDDKSENFLIKILLQKIAQEGDDVNDMFELLQDIRKKPHLVTVYDETSKLDIDQVILRAAMKVNQDDTKNALYLAQIWNRSDIIKYNEALGSTNYTTNSKAHRKAEKNYKGNLHIALVNNQVGFVKLFLENKCAILDTYLTRPILEKLYREVQVSTNSPLFPVIEKRANEDPPKLIDLDDVDKVIKSLTLETFQFITDNHNDGYDWYRTPGKYRFQYVLPRIRHRSMVTFRVRAKSDAHIALSEKNRCGDRMYHIVLGRERNQKSSISLGREQKCKAHSPDLLSGDHFRHFFIDFDSHDIKVGLVGEAPFMQYSGVNTFDINYIGFCTANKSRGVWEFSTFGYEQYETPSDEEKYQYVLPRIPTQRKIITFRIKMSSEAYIALSPKNKDDIKRPMYEIVLGGIDNPMSAIRLRKQGDNVVEEATPGLLSDEEFRHFYISFDQDIRIGLVGQAPFMQYKHSDPYDINFIGFQTRVGSAGVWEFCTFEFLEADLLPDPERQLFLFAILNMFDEMARYFWEEGEDHIASALTATKIYKSMAKEQHTELRHHLLATANEYEQLACDILTEIESQTDENDTADMLIRVLPDWGNTTCLKLAEKAKSLEFISHFAAQGVLDDIWANGLPKHVEQADAFEGPILMSTSKRVRASDVMSSVKEFFEAPKTIFWTNLIFHVLYLALFSYVMVSDQLSEPSPTVFEWVLFGWTFTFITEEIRQLAQADLIYTVKELRLREWSIRTTLKVKLQEYGSNYWNWFDVIMLSLFVIGVVLRFLQTERRDARVFLAFSLFFFYFRLLHSGTLFRKIGPKVIMISRMMKDLIFFVGILLIVLVGYGITVQAILYPHVTDPVAVLKGITYRPAFQIYGDLFLEEITANIEDGTCNNDDADSPCPEYPEIGVFCLALYMLISNILLLNLLIAMFSNTFQKVQDDTDKHWKFQRYNLTTEFFNRPVLAPPLIIIVHVFRLTRVILQTLEVLSWNPIDQMSRQFPPDYEGKLIKTEQRYAYDYVTRKRNEEANSSEETLLARLNELEKQIKRAYQTPTGPTDRRQSLDRKRTSRNGSRYLEKSLM